MLDWKTERELLLKKALLFCCEGDMRKLLSSDTSARFDAGYYYTQAFVRVVHTTIGGTLRPRIGNPFLFHTLLQTSTISLV